jgi:hypothetical protein
MFFSEARSMMEFRPPPSGAFTLPESLVGGVYWSLSWFVIFLSILGFLFARSVGLVVQDQAKRIEELERKISENRSSG